MSRMNFRNKVPFWYAVYDGTSVGYDEYGNENSAYATYADPVLAYGNISPAKGAAIERQFGADDQYDKVIAIGERDIPIDEAAVLWIDDDALMAEMTDQTGEPLVTESGARIWAKTVPGARNADGTFVLPYNYVVRRVARGLPNFGTTVIAISKVSVS